MTSVCLFNDYCKFWDVTRHLISNKKSRNLAVNPFDPRNFTEKRHLNLFEPVSGHGLALKSQNLSKTLLQAEHFMTFCSRFKTTDSELSSGKVLGKAFKIVALGGRKYRGYCKKIFIEIFGSTVHISCRFLRLP